MVPTLPASWSSCPPGVCRSHKHVDTSTALRSPSWRQPQTCIQLGHTGAAAPVARHCTAFGHFRSLSAQRVGHRCSSADSSSPASSLPQTPFQQQHMPRNVSPAGFDARIARATSAVAALLRYLRHLRWGWIQICNAPTAACATRGSMQSLLFPASKGVMLVHACHGASAGRASPNSIRGCAWEQQQRCR
jgi:hypothetical protein